MLLQSEAGVVQPIFRIECGGIFTWKTVSRGGVLFWKTRKVFRIDPKGVSLLQHSISVTTCVKYYLHLDVWKRSSTANRPIPWIIPRIMQWQAAGGDDNTLYSFVIHFVLSACLKNEQPRRWGGFNETKCSELIWSFLWVQHILLLAGRKTTAADGRQTDSERRIIFARTTVGWDGNLSYAVVNKCANSRYRRTDNG